MAVLELFISVCGAIGPEELALQGQRLTPRHPGVLKAHLLDRHVGRVFTFDGERSFVVDAQAHAVFAVNFLGHLKAEFWLDDTEVNTCVPSGFIDFERPGNPRSTHRWGPVACMAQIIRFLSRVGDHDVVAIFYALKAVSPVLASCGFGHRKV